MNTNSIQVIKKYKSDKTRLMDMLIELQSSKGYISGDDKSNIARELKIARIDVEQTISFYHFFSQTPTGKYTIYLNNSVVACMKGRERIVRAFEEATGCSWGQLSGDGLIGLYDTSCIGMNDQEPAAIINGKIFTKLTPFRVKEIVTDIKAGKPVGEMFSASYGDGMNNNKLIKAVVNNNIRKVGPILKDDVKVGAAIKKVIQLTPKQVIDEVKDSKLRGRGGAGFPTGLKWEFCREAEGNTKYIFCNADEGEPGTFKDRVILTEMPRLLLEGMIIAGYAVGAEEGILYVRYEYKYLEKYLEVILQKAREKNYLGKDICGKKGFNFDIRIQFGAGAYVCGEESALIESAEGKRGEPRDRPPFPVEKGYLEQPTVVNNVETFCSIVKVIHNGGKWYRSYGTKESTGTKLLSISGDCQFPGVYEIEWGFNVNDMLEMIGASDVQAVQVGGPSGSLIGPNDFNRILGFEDLATGGSIIVFNGERDLIKDVVLNFTEFFIEESCGSCSTCRIIPVLLKNKLLKIINARGVNKDIDDMLKWADTLKVSRCGLGHTASYPITTSIKNFRYLYEEKIQNDLEYDEGFDLNEAIKDSIKVTNRTYDHV